MKKLVIRPQIPNDAELVLRYDSTKYASEPVIKKISCRNEFELCYLRHQYLRKVKYNPTAEDMRPFMKISTSFAKRTYSTYVHLFRLVGLEMEDVVNIAQVHLVSFLGLFSLESMPEKYKEFVSYFKQIHDHKPTKDDLLDKNKAHFTLFIKQRMEDVVRVCRQKARNIKGIPADSYYYYCGPRRPPSPITDLLKDYENLGFRKLDAAIYRAIKKKAPSTTELVFRFDGLWYVSVPLRKKQLIIEDLSGAGLNPYDNMHNMTPEDIYFDLEGTSAMEKNTEEFHNSTPEEKRMMIEDFIKEKRRDPKFKEEIQAARKMLRGLQ